MQQEFDEGYWIGENDSCTFGLIIIETCLFACQNNILVCKLTEITSKWYLILVTFHCLACLLSHFKRHQGYFDNKTAFEWWIATSKLIKETFFLTNEVLIFSFVDFQCDLITSDGAIDSRSLPFKLNLKVSSPWDQILRTLLWRECLSWDVNQVELWKFNENCVR